MWKTTCRGRADYACVRAYACVYAPHAHATASVACCPGFLPHDTDIPHRFKKKKKKKKKLCVCVGGGGGGGYDSFNWSRTSLTPTGNGN